MRFATVMATLVFWSSTSFAQEAATTTAPVPTPTDTPASMKAEHERRVADDPDYRSGRSTRTSGIVLLGVGMGLGAILATFGSLSGLTGGEQKAMPFFVAGGVSAIIGLGVGIPLWIFGQAQVNHARSRVGWSAAPLVSASLGDRTGAIQAVWRW